jgi:hypothetical protein
VNGKKHGKGKYTNAYGDVFEGEFVNGQKQGKGKWTRANVGRNCANIIFVARALFYSITL